MRNFTLKQLYKFYDKITSENYPDKDIDRIADLIRTKEGDVVFEDVSATGGPSGSVGGSSVGSFGVGLANSTTAGMGGVVSSQPSAFPGSLNGTNWINGGGKSGSGDISVPYNPSGANRMFQKIPMGKNHGAKTGKKSRIKGIDMKALKNMFAKNQDITTKSEKPKRVMNFDDFQKDEFTKVTKIKEGKTFAASKTKYSKGEEKVTSMQDSIKSHIKSREDWSDVKMKQIGDDFEVNISGNMILQIMFRPDHIGLKSTDSKFPTKYKYNELGKIKKDISSIINKEL